MATAPSKPPAFRRAARSRRRCPVAPPIFSSSARASQTMDGKKKDVYKELGLFSLKKRVEDAVNRAAILAPSALELEETRRIHKERMFHQLNLWDDVSTSNASLRALSDAVKVVNDLKDMRYKAEEAKLITDLAEMDFVNNELFELAYDASIDINKFLDRYEIYKLLRGPYDKEGACLVVRAEEETHASKTWAEKLLCMYIKWAEKHGYKERILEKYPSKGGGISFVTVEFESEYAYGYLSGERGLHRMIRSSLDCSVVHENLSADVDVIPLFLEGVPDLEIDNKDLKVSFPAHLLENDGYITEAAVNIKHIPTGIDFQCSGERSQFANKIKALNRLKAKLLVLASEGMWERRRVIGENTAKSAKRETRRYIFCPSRLVQDVKTGIQMRDLNSILEGNIEPLLRANMTLRYGRETV